MNTPLQLLIQGEGISEWELSLEGGNGVSIKQIHKAESPNYLFVDLAFAPSAKSGEVRLRFTKAEQSFSVPYRIYDREEGSAERQSFSTEDAVYLIMPDRFVNGDKTNDA